MTYPPAKPIPPRDFTERALLPLDHGDSSICVTAAKGMIALSSRQQRSIDLSL